MQRPPTSAVASTIVIRRPAATRRRAAAIPAAPAPMMTASRPLSGRGGFFCREPVWASAGAAVTAVDAARNVRRLTRFMTAGMAWDDDRWRWSDITLPQAGLRRKRFRRVPFSGGRCHTRAAIFADNGAGGTRMLDAAFKALAQMFSQPFRSVLWKSIGLALVLIVIVGIGLHRLLVWLVTIGEGWAEQTL